MNLKQLKIDHNYISLALASDIVVKERPVVFHYYGPKELKKTAKEIAKKGKDFIIGELTKLEERIKIEAKDSPPFFRQTYLISQVRSLKGMITIPDTKLEGVELLEGVAAVLGMVPPLPYDIKELMGEEEEVLSRYGYDDYREFQAEERRRGSTPVTDKEILGLIEKLKDVSISDVVPRLFWNEELEEAVLRSRVTLAGPKDGYPPCYYIYKGKGRAEISLSNEHRNKKLTALRTLMHELYPGHHLYYLYRETLKSLGAFGDETTLDLVYGAETPMSEGVAEVMPYMISSLEEDLRAPLEITTTHEHFCKKALYNVWYYKFVSGNMGDSSATEYLKACGFENENVETWLKFIDDWRLYYPSYPVGTSILMDHLKSEGENALMYLYLPKTFKVLEKLSCTASERRIHSARARGVWGEGAPLGRGESFPPSE